MSQISNQHLLKSPGPHSTCCQMISSVLCGTRPLLVHISFRVFSCFSLRINLLLPSAIHLVFSYQPPYFHHPAFSTSAATRHLVPPRSTSPPPPLQLIHLPEPGTTYACISETLINVPLLPASGSNYIN